MVLRSNAFFCPAFWQPCRRGRLSGLDKHSWLNQSGLMTSLRILLALVIALALPVQALADTRMAVDCCPMSAEAEAQLETQSTGHDCCHESDADGAGMSCDAGSCCPCGAHLALPLHVFLTATHERARTLAAFSAPPHPAPPDTHWRPPALRTALI
jgi:hypothetical protein